CTSCRSTATPAGSPTASPSPTRAASCAAGGCSGAAGPSRARRGPAPSPDRMGPMRSVTLLGSTGSIGTQAVDVVGRNPDRFRVDALTAGGSDLPLLARQAADL